MAQATLVGPDINEGSEAIAALDAAQIKPVVALLAYLPEYEDWRLIPSSPALDQTHQLHAYDKVFGIWKGRFVSSLPTTMILPMKDPFIRELRRLFRKAKNVSGTRLSAQTVGNRYLSNAYIYRVH